MEETDEFVIYRPPYTPDWLVDAIILFRQVYRDVNVTIVDFSTSGTYEERCKQYQDRINNELMAGEGPDIIFPQYLSENIHKAIQGNIYLDLTPFFEQDKNFNEEDFMPGVFDAGRYQGRQYIVPTHVGYPLFIARNPVLKQLGIDQVASEDTASFMRQLGEKSQQAREELDFDRMMPQTMCFNYFLTCANLNLIDYTNRQVCPEPEKIREFMEAYKTYYKWDYNDGEPDYGRNSSFPYLPENYCYSSLQSEPHNLQVTGAIYTYVDGGYYDFFLKDMDGKINGMYAEYAAVPVTSKNQLNAYRFIQLMLSTTIQEKETSEGYTTDVKYYCPVNREALEARIRKRMGRTEENFYEESGQVGLIDALPATSWLDHIEKMRTVDSSVLPDKTPLEMTWEIMEPFFKDDRSYEACFDELKARLTIYMDE